MAPHPTRAQLRQEWMVADQAIVVALLGDWPDAVDAVRGIIAIGIAAETGRPLHMLCHPQARGIQRAINITSSMNRPDRIIMDDQALPPWPVLAGCDLAVAIGPHTQSSVQIAQAMGLQVIEDQGQADRTISAALVAAARWLDANRDRADT